MGRSFVYSGAALVSVDVGQLSAQSSANSHPIQVVILSGVEGPLNLFSGKGEPLLHFEMCTYNSLRICWLDYFHHVTVNIYLTRANLTLVLVERIQEPFGLAFDPVHAEVVGWSDRGFRHA